VCESDFISNPVEEPFSSVGARPARRDYSCCRVVACLRVAAMLSGVVKRRVCTEHSALGKRIHVYIVLNYVLQCVAVRGSVLLNVTVC